MAKGKTVEPVHKGGKPHAATASKKIQENKSAEFAFGKINYQLMVTGILVMFIGYLLMAGGKSDDPSVFNPEIFSFRRITLAPIIVTIGIIIEFYAIIKKAD